MNAGEVYRGSDGEATKRLYAQLETHGPIGIVAVNLFRACKASERAKVYRGGVRGQGSYRSMAYQRKEWALSNLCQALEQHSDKFDSYWGWREDPNTIHGDRPMWVLYVELPGLGQVSFHAPNRGRGPDYASEWDGQHLSAERIIQFCDSILETKRQLAL